MPPHLTIRATTNPATVGSVVFGIDANPSAHTEGAWPYDMAGDNDPTHPMVWTPVLGSHTVTATPFTGTMGAGTAGTPGTISFTVLSTPPPTSGQSVTSFTLINADNNTAVAGFSPLTNGAQLTLSTLPPHLTIRATTNPATVGSVVFGIDANPSAHTEGAWPYDIGGDNDPTHPMVWTPVLGSHTVTATPFTGTMGAGTAGTPGTISFTVR